MEWEEAKQLETDLRIEGLLDLPVDILGVEVGHLTIRKLMLLSYAQCDPFKDFASAITFVWLVSTSYEQDAKKARRFKRKLVKRFKRRPVELLEAINEYIGHETLDHPGWTNSPISGSERYFAPYTTLYERLCSLYGYNEALLDVPILAVMQLLKANAVNNGRGNEYPMFNPISDRVLMEKLKNG